MMFLAMVAIVIGLGICFVEEIREPNDKEADE